MILVKSAYHHVYKSGRGGHRRLFVYAYHNEVPTYMHTAYAWSLANAASPEGFLFSTDWTLREDRAVERPSPARRAILRSRRPRWTTLDVRRDSASTGRKDWTMNDLMDGPKRRPCGAVPGPPARERGHRHGVGRGGRTARRWAPLV